MLPRGKVLLVDDEPGSLETLRDVLEGEGYQVAQAVNGYEARERVKQEGFCLALLDYCMPGLNGIQTLTEIQKVRPGQATAFMTAYVVPELATLGSRGGCLGTFAKPLNIASLLAVLERGGVPAVQESGLTAGPGKEVWDVL